MAESSHAQTGRTNGHRPTDRQTIFLVVFLAVLILDVDIGVGIRVAYAIMTVMFRLQKPKVRGLGRMPGTDIYKPVDVYIKACPVPSVRIVRVDAPIYFANAAYIKTRPYNLAGLHNAMTLLRQEKDDTEDDVAEKYAFTNTLALEDNEPATAEQFRSSAIERRMSRTSTMHPHLSEDGRATLGQVAKPTGSI